MLKLSEKNRTIINIIICSIILVATTFVMIEYFSGGNQSPLGDTTNGIYALRAFTNESNIFSALVSFALIIVSIRNLFRRRYICPRILRVFQLLSTTTVTLTFIVVVIFLNPLYASKTGEIFRLFQHELVYTHLFGPLLAVLSFLFFTPHDRRIKKIQIPLVLVPVLLYGAIYMANVVLLQTWPDFYNFTFDGRYALVPLVSLVIFIISLFIATALNHFSIKANEEAAHNE